MAIPLLAGIQSESEVRMCTLLKHAALQHTCTVGRMHKISNLILQRMFAKSQERQAPVAGLGTGS